MTEYTVTVVINGDLESPDEEGAAARAKEIADGLRSLAEDLGLKFVSRDVEVEEL